MKDDAEHAFFGFDYEGGQFDVLAAELEAQRDGVGRAEIGRLAEFDGETCGGDVAGDRLVAAAIVE